MPAGGRIRLGTRWLHDRAHAQRNLRRPPGSPGLCRRSRRSHSPWSLPVTLLLRTLPVRQGRQSDRGPAQPARQGAHHPAVALLLSADDLALLYDTPLYNASISHPAGHWLLHAHSLLPGVPVRPRHRGPTRPGSEPPAGLPRRHHRRALGGLPPDVRRLLDRQPRPSADQVQGGAEIMY
ncbi:cytochrome c oxidase assembly protein [Streptomyces aureocirculatus]|uniref:cytochrome c oxidase assembly protein n=1 Tax=Streptomyces aureocirculatus TaxID=67275 RepID=UPI001CED7BB2